MTINSDIHIVVQSKYPHILENFKKSFFETTKNFSKLTLHIIDGSSYGAIEINKILRPLLSKREGYAFGVFNDDLVFSEGWLEDVCEALKSNHCVSGGYVETDDMDVFKKAVDMTKDDEGFVPLLYGPNAVFRMDIFQSIGIFDERFEWSVDDLDFAWRIKLNGLSSITLKRIRTCHLFGKTREHNMKQWNYISTLNKEKFYDKHGYRSYRNIRGEYKKWHRYFQCYKT